MTLPRLRLLRCLLAVGLCAGLPVSGAAADWHWRLEGAALGTGAAALDAGGEVEYRRGYVQLGASRRLDDGSRIGLSLGYGESDYDFAGAAGLASVNPWGRVRQLRLGASVRHPLGDRWTLFGIPSVSFDVERGASWSDGATFGLLAGAAYRFSDTLSIGPGLGGFSEIEDSASLFPILLVDWQISDRLSLETGRGFAATRGPGLQLRWRQSPAWTFSAGARYEQRRFRLDDSGVAPHGVGEDTALPVYLAADYAPGESWSLTLLGGVETGRELRLEDRNGRRVQAADGDEAAFFGVGLRIDL